MYACRYFYKYSVKDIVLQEQILCNLLKSYNVKEKHISKEIENFIYNFFNNTEDNNKTAIEQQMFELYRKNLLFQKEEFYNYILSNNKKGHDTEKTKFYNYVLSKLEIERKDIKLFSKPNSLVVTLTNVCNIKCSFCRIHRAKLWTLSKDKIEEIIKLMPYINSVSWLGGEVFLYKGFDKLFDIALKNNVFQEITTNGLLLNKTLIDKFVSAPMQLSISITSVQKKKYETLHIGSNFDKLLSNLDLIRNSIIKKNKNFSYWIRTCVMKENLTDLEDIVEFAYKYKFDVVRFQPLVQLDFNFYNKDIVKYFVKKALLKARNYNIKIINVLPIDFGNYTEINFSEKEIKEKLTDLFVDETEKDLNETEKEKKCSKSLYDGVQEYKKMTDNDNISVNKEVLFCDKPWTTMVLNYDGEVTFDWPCLFNKLETVKDKSLLSAWNSPKVQNFREQIKKKNIYDICNYDCIAYNVHRIKRG